MEIAIDYNWPPAIWNNLTEQKTPPCGIGARIQAKTIVTVVVLPLVSSWGGRTVLVNNLGEFSNLLHFWENFFLGYLSFIIPDRKLSYKDKTVVELTEKESDIIVSLFNSSDRGITKEEVMSQVWMLSPNIETHTFETHLFRLRKKISFFIKWRVPFTIYRLQTIKKF